MKYISLTYQYPKSTQSAGRNTIKKEWIWINIQFALVWAKPNSYLHFDLSLFQFDFECWKWGSNRWCNFRGIHVTDILFNKTTFANTWKIPMNECKYFVAASFVYTKSTENRLCIIRKKWSAIVVSCAFGQGLFVDIFIFVCSLLCNHLQRINSQTM